MLNLAQQIITSNASKFALGIAAAAAIATMAAPTAAEARYQPANIGGGVCMKSVCVQWAQGAPGTFAGKCIRTQIKRVSCGGSNLR